MRKEKEGGESFFKGAIITKLLAPRWWGPALLPEQREISKEVAGQAQKWRLR
jgi:hypothetical protein